MEKFPHHAGHPLNLGFGKFWENRQTQAFARRLLGDREIAGPMPEEGVGLLQMERQRVVERAANVIGFQVLFEFVPAGMAHHVKVPGAFGIVCFPGQLQRRAGE